MKVIFGESGSTWRSLKTLRDELAKRIMHSVDVFIIETQVNDPCRICGALIVDHDASEAVWTGDDFRRDKAGTGGAGYRGLISFLAIYGITPYHFSVKELKGKSVREGIEILATEELLSEYNSKTKLINRTPRC